MTSLSGTAAHQEPAARYGGASMVPLPDLAGLHGLGLPLEFFWQMVEQAPLAITVTDLSAQILYSNPAFTELTGFSRGELKGRNHNLLASQQTPRSRYQAMWQALGQGQSWTGHLINRRKDGSIYLADVTVAPLCDSSGRVSHFLGMQRNISEHFALEQRLKNQMALLESILNAAPFAVAVLDDRGHVLLDNLAYKTLRSDLDKREPWQVLQEANPEWQDGRPLLPVPIRRETRWFSEQILPLESLSEEIAHYFGQGRRSCSLLLIEDWTAERQHHEAMHLHQLRQRLDEQRLILTVQEALEAAALHLRAPLNQLHAASRLKLPGTDNPVLKLASEEGERAWQWLHACRPALEQEPLIPLELRSLLLDVNTLFNEPGQHDPLCLLSLPPNGIRLLGQPLRLLLALQQLLCFQCEHLPDEGAMLKLSWRISEQQLFLLLEDNGQYPFNLIGDKVYPFNRLWQYSETARLALSLVQGIINDHQGLIGLKLSGLGGALIRLEFPLLLEDRRS